MLRFRKNSGAYHELDQDISKALCGLISKRADRLGYLIPGGGRFEKDPSPVGLRYDPMKRRLVEDRVMARIGFGFEDVRTVSKQNRQFYYEYLQSLTIETRYARTLRSGALTATGKWDFRAAFGDALLFESTLLMLHFQAWRHALRITVGR